MRLPIVCILALCCLLSQSAAAGEMARADAAPALTLSDLRDGDVAMIRGNTVAARFVLSVSGEGARFSHCGIIVAEAGVDSGGESGGWSLVHAAPRNEAAGDQGLAEAVPLSTFSQRASVSMLEIYRADNSEKAAAAAAAARAYADEALPFDDAFDLSSDDRLYCSELVWKAYLDAGLPCLVGDRFDELDSVFFAGPVILPASLAHSTQLRRVGVLEMESKDATSIETKQRK